MHRQGPSVVKARPPQLLESPRTFLRSSEGRWRELFERADVISEGAVHEENGERSWFGSTSLILSLPQGMEGPERELALRVAQRDVHVHVHALRCAHREAQSRAPGMLGRTVCDVKFVDDRRGLRIDVDLQAPLIERRRVARAGP